MKPSELRLGNFVNFKDRDDIDYCEVTALDTGGYIHILRNFKDGQGDDQPENIEDITPIVLTEEWLDRLGIKKEYLENPFEVGGYDLDEKGNKWYHWVRGVFNLEIQTNGEIWFEVYSHYVHIEYVHQLQNLYHGLTKEDLVLDAPKEPIKETPQ